MACNLVKTIAGEKMAIPVASMEEYLKLRNNPAHQDYLKLARNGKRKAKMSLTQFNYSGHYPGGKVRGTKLIANAFMFDIDDKETFDRVAPEILARAKELGLLMLERSVNYGGHAVFARQRGKTILEEQVRIATALHCEMDNCAHDINRVVFATGTTSDDLLYCSEQLFADRYEKDEVEEETRLVNDRQAQQLEKLPPSAHKANKHYKPWEDSASAPLPDTTPAQGTAQPDANPLETEDGKPITDNYHGIPYSEIVDAYWELNNGGNKPSSGDRNTLTYEIAYDFRHICSHSRKWLDKVIECYDGLPYAEKMRCIDSALSARKTSLTRKMKDALELVKRKHNFDPAIVTALDGALEDDSTYYADRLPELPMGLCDAVAAVGPQLAMPTLFASCPAIGALGTHVMLTVHGVPNHLNLITYIAGDFASNKGAMDSIVNQWMEETKSTDRMFLKQEDEWVRQKHAAKNSKQQPEERKNPIKYLTLNNTVANLADRLANTRGEHAFSFTCEADNLAVKFRSSMSDYSIMLRQAYDGSAYEREARSIDAVRVHIDHLLWNVVMCGTPDALFRVINNNYTDGFLSRIALARTPDNTYMPLREKAYLLTPDMAQRISTVAHVLPLMKGTLELEALENTGREWLEQIRLESMKNDDRVLARGRFRTCVTAQRMVGCIVLCAAVEELIGQHGLAGTEEMLKKDPYAWIGTAEKAGQKKELLDCFDVIADYMLENTMMYFHDKMESAFESPEYTGSHKGRRHGKNITIYAMLPDRFDMEEAYQCTLRFKGAKVTRRTVSSMLYNWKKQGLIVSDNDSYCKANK